MLSLVFTVMVSFIFLRVFVFKIFVRSLSTGALMISTWNLVVNTPTIEPGIISLKCSIIHSFCCFESCTEIYQYKLRRTIWGWNHTYIHILVFKLLKFTGGYFQKLMMLKRLKKTLGQVPVPQPRDICGIYLKIPTIPEQLRWAPDYENV